MVRLIHVQGPKFHRALVFSRLQLTAAIFFFSGRHDSRNGHHEFDGAGPRAQTWLAYKDFYHFGQKVLSLIVVYRGLCTTVEAPSLLAVLGCTFPVDGYCSMFGGQSHSISATRGSYSSGSETKKFMQIKLPS